MESDRFDVLTRRLGAARNRRQTMATLAASAVALLFQGAAVDEATAGCKGYRKKCKSQGACCDGVGLRCRKGRCRCKPGWQRCSSSGKGCTHVKADPDNCGVCGHECPPETPCCINGSCQETCGGSCCADCFVELLANNIPVPNSEICCPGGGSVVCSSNMNQTSDDFCCWPDQTCVDGECCSDGHDGAVICGGTCCASAACCNGECCPEGQVCATTTEGMACVTTDRSCESSANCHADETCVNGTCCQSELVCTNLGVDTCCSAGEYCDVLDGNGICCDINKRCKSTWRGHRVRR